MSQNEVTNSQDLRIQKLLNAFLRLRASGGKSSVKIQHLDEDSFAAFVEGSVGEREAQSILSHLVECSFCRNVTAELVKLDYAFADEEIRVGETGSVPSRVSEVLSNLLSRIFGINDDVVFAHQETDEESEDEKKSDNGRE